MKQLGLFDCIEVPVSNGYIAVIDSIDSDLTEYHWSVGSDLHPRGAYTNPKTTVSLHTIILTRKLGRTLLSHEMCDHKDRNPLNNRRENLRLATSAKNRANTGLTAANRSGYKGVHWNYCNAFCTAQISVDRKHLALGRFIDAITAARAYDIAALKYHGEFAVTNEMLGLLPSEAEWPSTQPLSTAARPEDR